MQGEIKNRTMGLKRDGGLAAGFAAGLAVLFGTEARKTPQHSRLMTEEEQQAVCLEIERLRAKMAAGTGDVQSSTLPFVTLENPCYNRSTIGAMEVC